MNFPIILSSSLDGAIHIFGLNPRSNQPQSILMMKQNNPILSLIAQSSLQQTSELITNANEVSLRYAYGPQLLHNMPEIKQIGHTDRVNTVKSDDQIVVTGSDDHTVRVQTKKDGSLVGQINGHSAPVHTLDISSKQILTGSMDKKVILWDRKSLKKLRTYIHSDEVKLVKFVEIGGDKNVIVTSSTNGSVRIYKRLDNKLLDNLNQKVLQGHSDSVNCIDQDSFNMIQTASVDKTIKIWSIMDNEMVDIRLVKSVDLQTGINSIQIDQGNIVCGLDDGRLAIVDMREHFVSYFDAHQQAITSVEVLGQFHGQKTNSLLEENEG